MRLVLRDVRLSFPDLFVAVQYNGTGPFNYRASFLFEPDSQADKDILAAMKTESQNKWGKKGDAMYATILPNAGKCCYGDGDTKAYMGYEGMKFITASRGKDAGAPLVVDRKKNKLSQEDAVVYAGCYVNAVVDIWPQDNSFGKGLRATLVTIQFVKDGESFGGAAPATDKDLDELEFEDDDMDPNSPF